MPRKVKLPENFRPDDTKLWEKKHPEPIKAEYRLVTPLYGGGEKVNRADSVSTIRVSSIKGQLRFWWRAIRGWQAQGDLKRMLELEEVIWGGVSKVKQSSRAELMVEVISPETPDEITHISARAVPRYVAFPLLQGTSDEDKKEALSKDIHFRLTIYIHPMLQEKNDEKKHDTYFTEKALKEEVEAAKWAWETFGGIGARTRRGFGALEAAVQSLEDIQKGLQKYSHPNTEAWPQNIPHLTTNSNVAVLDRSWESIIDLYQRFRQYRPDVKTIWHKGKEKQVPGPNKWPEATLLRWAYAPRRYNKPDLRVAPRVQFGLPVPFFFLQDNKLGNKGKMIFTGKRRPKEDRIDRLASPLIIRPLSKQKTLIAILEGPHTPPGDVFLDPPPIAEELLGKPINTDLSPEEAKELIKAGLKVLEVNGQVYTNPVLAFLKCVQDKSCVQLLLKVHTGR